MKRKNLLPRAVLAAILLLVVPAAADAPRGQYDKFDQDSPTIRDVLTKLEWDRNNIQVDTTHGLATATCPSHGANYRLPTVKELLTLVDEDPHEEYEFGALVAKTIDQLAFDKQPVNLPYWTSTPAGAGKVWTVSFATGLLEARNTSGDKAHARCVR